MTLWQNIVEALQLIVLLIAIIVWVVVMVLVAVAAYKIGIAYYHGML